jgi:ribosomal-protein-alanine N-acetyltransferase
MEATEYEVVAVGRSMLRCFIVDAIASTRRLLIRPWRDDDAVPLAAMGSDLEFVRYLQGRPWTIDDATGMISNCRAVNDEIGVTLWALEDRASSDLVGYCGLAKTNAACVRTDFIEIGWGIEHSRWGQGLATEAASRVMALASDRFARGWVIAKCHIDNRASERVMQHVGLQRVGVIRYLDNATVLYRSR